MGKNVKIEFDNKHMENIINTLYREKDNLLKERDSLRETIDELKCGELSTKLDSKYFPVAHSLIHSNKQ